jgi:tetratricopeptide (TPR) repeat protein
MAEHNDGNRGGKDRGNFGGGRNTGGGGFRGTNNSGGDPRGFRAREDRGTEGSRPSFNERDRKPSGDRPARESDRKPFSGGGDRDRKPYGDRAPRDGGGERRSFGGGDRDRKPFSGGGDRDRKPFAGGGDRDRKPFGDRAPRDGGGERRSFGGGDRDRKPFSGGDNRKPFGSRDDRPARSFDRDDRPARGFDRGGDSGPRQFGRDRAEDRPVRVPNARDLRSANRPDRERSPQIDDDVTGKELDRATQHQIKTLEDNSAEWVARHLVMAGRLIDDEPELAFQHALAASRRGGRLAAVREAVGLTAYAAGHYGEALREFRTYRRISGSNMHLPVMADCERGLGRPDRALDMARSDEAKDLDAPGKVELAIVAAGARSDLGQFDAAVSELEIAQLDINRAFSYSPRLFRAYADALTAAGRAPEAEKWNRQAVVAENALGVAGEEEPDIIDLGWDEEEEAREEEQQRRLVAQQQAAEKSAAAEESAPRAATAAAVAGIAETPAADSGLAALEEGSEDAEPGFFESDDAESDEDSVERDALDRSELLAGDESEDVAEDAADEYDADEFDADHATDPDQPNRTED